MNNRQKALLRMSREAAEVKSPPLAASMTPAHPLPVVKAQKKKAKKK